jgi:hypothetical protein
MARTGVYELRLSPGLALDLTPQPVRTQGKRHELPSLANALPRDARFAVR